MTKKQLVDEIKRIRREIDDIKFEAGKAYRRTKFEEYKELVDKLVELRKEMPLTYARDTKAQLEEKFEKMCELNRRAIRMLIDTNDEYMAHLNRAAAV